MYVFMLILVSGMGAFVCEQCGKEFTGQIYQDIKTPIIKKQSPVIHVNLPPIQNEVWMNIKIGSIAP